MKDESAVGVVCGALLVGALFDGLSRVGPLGVGYVLSIGVATVTVLIVARVSGRALDSRVLALAIGGIACGSMIALRDSATLVAFDLFVGLALLAVIPVSILGVRLDRLGPVEWLLTVIVAAVDSATGAIFFLVRDLPWPRIRGARVGRPLLAVTRGTILAAPPLIVFGVLLSSADAVFEHFITELIDIDFETLLAHLVFFGIGTWIAMGWLARAAGSREPSRVSLAVPGSARLGLAEISLILGSIDVLFLGFVVVQFRYFFGGTELIKAVPGLTRAEYARSGFFQLVTVATLVVVLLLFADWIVDRSARTLRWARLLAAVQVALVMVMLSSAWIRMQLYVGEFGLTELRFYTSAFMILLGGVLIWFCATVLVDRRERFAAGVVALGVTGLIALNVVNPEAIIVRTNVERAAAGKALDTTYLNRLSADAVPAIIELLGDVKLEQRKELVSGLESRAEVPPDWRTWNVSRVEARRMSGELLRR